jgi:hypothetical protein
MNPQDKPAGPAQPQNSPAAQQPDPVQQDDIQNPQADDSLDKQQFTEISLPTEAQDSDLIEKEWVERAKQIVEHTREDPYEQLRALSHMKADYLKKRYNKDIKITDE